MSATSTEEMERPAKRWEVGQLADKLDNQNSIMETLSAKIDKLDAKQITKADLSEKMEDIEKHIAGEVKQIHLTYGPLAKNARKLAWSLILACIGLVFQVLIIIAQILITKT